MSRRNPGRGLLIYDGPSLLNGERIIAVLTTHSNNRKTGDVASLWILNAAHTPHHAAAIGADASVCGACPLRGDGRHRGCYVDLARAPLSVWKAWRRGLYAPAWETMPGPAGWSDSPPPTRPTALPAPSGGPPPCNAPQSILVRRATLGRVVRLGAYGDPAALPRDVLAALVQHARGWAGYTHQWRDGFALQDLVMASAESPQDFRDAAALGFRVFHVTAGVQPRAASVMVCPASAEREHHLTCDQCRACSGVGAGRPTAHVQIAAHGSASSTLRYALRVIESGARA